MRKTTVLTLSLVALFWMGIGNSARLTPAGVPASGQTRQPELLDRLVGNWMLESHVMGAGFFSRTHPGEGTPISRKGNKVTFNVSLQTGVRAYGVPDFDDFNFILEQTTGTEYALSVESKSWLNVTQLKLSLADGAVKGKTSIPFREGTAPLEVTIQTVQGGGHTWNLLLLQDDGKPMRYFELTFKPVPNQP